MVAWRLSSCQLFLRRWKYTLPREYAWMKVKKSNALERERELLAAGRDVRERGGSRSRMAAVTLAWLLPSKAFWPPPSRTPRL
jgi:hypothetical protein